MFLKFGIALIIYCCIAVKSVVHGAQPNIDQLQCDCGIANEMTAKIIGGEKVPPNKYPWMVSVFVNRGDTNATCGGALITRQYVLTAAICVTNQSNISVALAVNNLSEAGQLIRSSIIKIHPNFTREKADNDIALIKLVKGVEISERIRTLCLPHNFNFEQPGRNAIVAGWETTKPPRESRRILPSQFLKELNMKIVRTDSIITAQGTNGTGVCFGDAGSPLFTRYNDGRFHVIGVTSRGSNIPFPCLGVSHYARVSILKQWIINNVMDSVGCKRANDQTTPVATNYF